ncbi:hypothetical protein D0T50_06550 [Bacteroides sp. 214]|uniref:hypothetical protein n=1 Tax=Bacteroides sp. 214 TaxID=2302935 RepID=UPI0013D65ACE|nr:hypothetical protein [Bacteroides sp. 214]NDW12549.1 hypothetical protein [Bacteroides sp. 214]
MKKSYSILVVLLLISLGGHCYAQAPVVPVPQIKLPQGPKVPTVSTGNSVNPYSPHIPNGSFNQQAQQEAIMREVQAHQRQLQAASNNEIQHIQNEIQRQTDIIMLTKHGFPSQAEYEGTPAFYSAFDEISNMLDGQKELNLGRAVFLIENAWHNNKYDYSEYLKGIKAGVDFCNRKIEEEKLDKDDNLVKNMMLFRLVSDTLKIKNRTTGKPQTHYPIKYNYDDYESKISYDSHFVTTLMQTGVGQCHSMPLYYLVLAEEIGAEAYWSFSPRHSFVKIQDERGNWHNLELTCKAILSDTHYMNSGYIKAEALQNKTYLEPMDKTNVIAEMLLELARGYYQKYGYDDFYLKCIDTAQQYLKNDLNAKILKSAYQTRLTLTLAHLLQAPTPEIMQELSPEAYRHYELMLAQYKEIDDLGYEELPMGVYAMWLDHIAKEKEKAGKEKQPSIFIRKGVEHR